jgi:peptide/nickel transport system permease protein
MIGVAVARRPWPVLPRVRSRALVIGLAVLIVLLAAAALADMLYPGDPLDMVGRPTLWPGANPAFPLGTDTLGRDMAAELCHAARVSLLIGFAAASVSVLIGAVVGLLAGYFGGVADTLLMRLTELFQTMPGFLFAVVLVVILGPSVGSIILAIGITAWPQVARLVRVEALRIRHADYVLAAITMGIGHGRIIATHVLPNSLSPVIVAGSVLIANAILVEASLAFLGLGDPSVVSWGSMIGVGRDVLRTAWYMTAIPGMAVFITVLAFTLIGTGLADLLDPRQALR